MAHRWALVLAAAVLLALTGCSLFASPPQSLVAAARDYASAVQALPGVSDADAEVIAVDPKDRPGEWRVDLVVTATAAGESDAVAYAVWGIEPPAGAVINVTLRFPKSSGMPPVSLGDPSSATAERGRTLRTFPFVESVAIANTEIASVKEFEAAVAKVDKNKPVNVLFRRGEWASYALIRPSK